MVRTLEQVVTLRGVIQREFETLPEDDNFGNSNDEAKAFSGDLLNVLDQVLAETDDDAREFMLNELLHDDTLGNAVLLVTCWLHGDASDLDDYEV